MPLVSVYDAHPVGAGAGFVSSVVFVEELSHRLLAQAFSADAHKALVLAERVAWGFWRRGKAQTGAASPFEWSRGDAPFHVFPHAPPGADVLFRPVPEETGLVLVVGTEKGDGWGSAAFGTVSADTGLVQGPARWDHRVQYSTVRRAPRADGWGLADAIDEAGALPVARARKGPKPFEVLATLSKLSAENDGH